MLKGKAALDHGGCVENEREQQQQIIHSIVLAEALAPEENRIRGAQSIDNHRQKKEMPVSKPISQPVHGDRLSASGCGASDKIWPTQHYSCLLREHFYPSFISIAANR
jgi:hypothetical protein